VNVIVIISINVGLFEHVVEGIGVQDVEKKQRAGEK